MTEQTETPAVAPRVAIIGGGVMGGTIVTALRVGGWEPDKIVVSERDSTRAGALREGHGIEVTESVSKAVSGAEVIVVAVKPQDAAAALDEIAGDFPAGALVLTIAAGLPTAWYESKLPEGTAVVRAMPNTPAIVAHGATALAPGAHATQRDVAIAGAVLRATGLIVVVGEDQMDAVTAVSGSGPAYFYAVVEALTEAGVSQGLDRVLATQLAAQTFVGAARLLMESGDTPQILRQRVSSPGGTTIAALEAMAAAGLPDVIAAGADAAAKRAKELGEELGS